MQRTSLKEKLEAFKAKVAGTDKADNDKVKRKPAAKASLKARLAEKKILVSGKGKDHEAQENNKNSQREM